jgi:hypothetical protein
VLGEIRGKSACCAPCATLQASCSNVKAVALAAAPCSLAWGLLLLMLLE